MLSLRFPNTTNFPVHRQDQQPFSLTTLCTFQRKIKDGPADNFLQFFNEKSHLSKFRLAAGGGSKTAPGELDTEKNEIQLPEGLDPEMMPKHVAVIMDGHRRWARNEGLPIAVGHRAGAKIVTQHALTCAKFGIKVFSVFAFSSENWRRPKEEVEFLMHLYEEVIQLYSQELIQNSMRFTFIGDRSRLPESLQKQLSSLAFQEQQWNPDGHSSKL